MTSNQLSNRLYRIAPYFVFALVAVAPPVFEMILVGTLAAGLLTWAIVCATKKAPGPRVSDAFLQILVVAWLSFALMTVAEQVGVLKTANWSALFAIAAAGLTFVIVPYVRRAVDARSERPNVVSVGGHMIRSPDPEPESVALVADPARTLPVAVPFDSTVYRRSQVIHLSGVIDGAMATKFAQACRKAGAGRTITVEVSCPGGEIYAARSIYSALKVLAADNDVYVWVSGTCASAAITVITAVAPERRFAASFALFVVHTTSTNRYMDSYDTDLDNADFVSEPITSGTAVDTASLDRLLTSRRDYRFGTAKAIELGFVAGIMG